MQIVWPQVLLIAEMNNIPIGQSDLLEALGAPEWESDAQSGNENVIELAGRLCYKSFGTELNKNITTTRKGNTPYIANILKTKHGSVLEHAQTTVAFLSVSRIFTHELVRHRAGCAYSQESMRFVRLEDIPVYVPDLTGDFQELAKVLPPTDKVGKNPYTFAYDLQKTYEDAFRFLTEEAEACITSISRFLDLPGVPFGLKKKITSALRRMAPSGHTTNIIMTANHRAWRHLIELRTELSAEGEIREVFLLVADQFQLRYPALYQDMTIHPSGVVTFENSKV